ncbi:Macro domain [Seminavis robusta]|uniref:Macro domain n=1 Tax=Seminavis robusta TaxID=568900 RepID=A0A9N8HMC3_9STRA|nr:Macro domain [Seminavis robusta]|eukprot:Sro734_g194740.1 Macro domain (246) ;mRNA; f:37103-37840
MSVPSSSVPSSKATADHIEKSKIVVSYILCAHTNQSLRDAWAKTFSDIDGVNVAENGDLFQNPATALVSPANSYGYMDGGIDAFFTPALGYDVEEQLQNKMSELGRYKTEIGDALLLPVIQSSNDNKVYWDYWISAPTMVTPMVLKKKSRNAYLAFRAVLRVVQKHNQTAGEKHQTPITSVGVPGLGTGIGAMDPMESARHMREAYDEVILGKEPQEPTASGTKRSLDGTKKARQQPKKQRLRKK